MVNRVAMPTFMETDNFHRIILFWINEPGEGCYATHSSLSIDYEILTLF